MSRYRLVAAGKAEHAVARLCRALGMSRSGYYARATRPPSARATADAGLTAAIRAIRAAAGARTGRRACTPSWPTRTASAAGGSGSPA